MSEEESTTLRSFLNAYKHHPQTGGKVRIAKDLSFPNQEGEEAYVLILPLAVKELYMYVLPYVDKHTALTAYVLRISRIDDLARSGNHHIYNFNGAKTQGEAVMNKGSRFVSFLADYFDREQNELLYAAEGNGRISPPKAEKHDNDDVKYHNKCGYVTLTPQRRPMDGKMHCYVQVLCCRTAKGERLPAKVCNILAGEYSYVSNYLKFVIGFYKFNDPTTVGGLEKRYIDIGRNDVLKAIKKIEKMKKEIQK